MRLAPETSSHHAAIRALHTAAFPTPAEADLVEQLRHDADACIALVALAEEQVIGHVMLSRMVAPFRALGLGPIAVAREQRRRGIGAALIHEAIHRAKAADYEAVFVLGAPAYYQRFGFSAAAAAGFQSRYAGPHLMLLPLAASLPAQTGRIDYAPAFAALD